MTITPENQPHIPRLQIDIDEILAGIAFARSAHLRRNARYPFTILIDRHRTAGRPKSPGCIPRSSANA